MHLVASARQSSLQSFLGSLETISARTSRWSPAGCPTRTGIRADGSRTATIRVGRSPRLFGFLVSQRRKIGFQIRIRNATTVIPTRVMKDSATGCFGYHLPVIESRNDCLGCWASIGETLWHST